MRPNQQNAILNKITAFPKWEAQQNKSLSQFVRDGSLQIDNNSANMCFLKQVESEWEQKNIEFNVSLKIDNDPTVHRNMFIRPVSNDSQQWGGVRAESSNIGR